MQLYIYMYRIGFSLTTVSGGFDGGSEKCSSATGNGESQTASEIYDNAHVVYQVYCEVRWTW